MAHTDIDRVNGITIRKLHSTDKTKTFGYICGVKNEAGNLIDPTSPVGTLTEARKLCGFVNKPSTATLPKKSYPQNQPGYDPHRGR